MSETENQGLSVPTAPPYPNVCRVPLPPSRPGLCVRYNDSDSHMELRELHSFVALFLHVLMGFCQGHPTDRFGEIFV